MLIVLGIIIWLILGVSGAAIGRAKIRRDIGPGWEPDWTEPCCVTTVLAGPLGLASTLIFLSLY